MVLNLIDILPTESLQIFSPNTSSYGFDGIVLVTIIWSRYGLLMFVKAFPENNACVAKANTLLAPCSFNTFAASDRVPYAIYIKIQQYQSYHQQ